MSKNDTHRILITGASGFVGYALSLHAIRCGMQVRGTILAHETALLTSPGFETVEVEPLGPTANWGHAVTGIDTIVHLAARVHVMKEHATDPLKEFRAINTEGTLELAKQAAAAGVKRFVLMSTIGVNGNSSGDRAFTENDRPAPHNPYSASKLEAEISLKKLSAMTGMEVVIVRAPLVYGPGNPGNFRSLLNTIYRGIPLPLASVSNQRSFLYVENLADALSCCATHPEAAGQTYLVSDGKDVSTPELIRCVAAALGKPARLFPVPTSLMRTAGNMFGKSVAVERLIGSLQVNSSKIRHELDWMPPYTMEDGLRATAAWYLYKR